MDNGAELQCRFVGPCLAFLLSDPGVNVSVDHEAAAGTCVDLETAPKGRTLNSFYRALVGTFKTHYPDSDRRCACGQQRDDWEWADHATDEVVEALATEIGLAAEMRQDPGNHHIITRYITDWHDG
ncbi:hypothetical protein H7K24_14120 [Mycobacterium fragae]|uniref:Uncharacterized protein n=1 Tax=Mycobacterium fragae TaxID=1260918 RepID=A0A1X1UIW2_9MYCO|nr:hypothetical protein [Mycobacterium fragae]MCV7401290.1 hypothetical protein [Mycobacterium fragae]ORV56786.1 hypothetical protein AWC06_00810 [Mycobacterium fragae]